MRALWANDIFYVLRIYILMRSFINARGKVIYESKYGRKIEDLCAKITYLKQSYLKRKARF